MCLDFIYFRPFNIKEQSFSASSYMRLDSVMQRLKIVAQFFQLLLKRLSHIAGSVLKGLLGVLKSILKWFMKKLYRITVDVGEETGILAISLVVNRSLHIFERALWLLVVISTTVAAVILSELQLRRYLSSPTVVSVDRDYRGWNGSLPAVTLCYYDHIDSFKANDYIQEYWNVSIIDEDYFYFMDFLYAVVNATASNYADLARFAEDERFDDVDLLDLVHAINRPFDQVLSCFDADFDVEVIPVMTERGFCYAINAPMSKILTGGYIEYTDLKPPLTCQYGKQQCYIKMDLFESTGSVAIHSPFEVSATDSSVIALHKSDEILASYKVLETVASTNLRELRVSQRKCVFHDEETSQLKIYSKTLCLVRCRAIMALEMCNCVPFFYPFVDGPSCNPAGFECLLDFKWPIWALHICKCPSTCNEIEYSVHTIKKSSWGIKFNEEGIKSDVASSSLRWDLIPPKVRMRRDVVFSFEDLLVSFGGALALFLGFSILSITQLAYVLCLHLLESIYELMLHMHQQLKRLCMHCQVCAWQKEARRQVKEVKATNKPKLSLKGLLKRRDTSSENIETQELAANDTNENMDATAELAVFDYVE